MADDLAKRAAALIEAAFDESVKDAAKSEWFKIAGKVSSLAEVDKTFVEALRELAEIRTHQLAYVETVFGV